MTDYEAMAREFILAYGGADAFDRDEMSALSALLRRVMEEALHDCTDDCVVHRTRLATMEVIRALSTEQPASGPARRATK